MTPAPSKRATREEELRRLAPDTARDVDLSSLTENELNGLISVALRHGDLNLHRRRIRRRR